MQSLNYLGLDIGGTLLKAVLALSAPRPNLHSKLAFSLPQLYIHLYFLHFPSSLEGLAQLVSTLEAEGVSVDRTMATGGGAHKFYEQLCGKFKEVQLLGQFQSLSRGYKFIFSYKRDSIYSVAQSEARTSIFPFLLVNIGSGVSYLKIDVDFSEVKRLGGTSLGGGFFLGLARLVNGPCNFGQLLTSAVSGDNRRADLMLEDMYEADQVPQGLQGAQLLVSMGKTGKGATQDDVNKSLLYMVSFNLSLHAFLQQRLHGLQHVVFTGFFLRDNDVTYKCIEKAYKFFAGKEPGVASSCHFVQHDGFIGCFGCLFTLLSL